MTWMSADAQRRELDEDWQRLRASSNRWGFAFLLRHRKQERVRPPLASAEEMRRGKWKMNYERDDEGRLL